MMLGKVGLGFSISACPQKRRRLGESLIPTVLGQIQGTILIPDALLDGDGDPLITSALVGDL